MLLIFPHHAEAKKESPATVKAMAGMALVAFVFSVISTMAGWGFITPIAWLVTAIYLVHAVTGYYSANIFEPLSERTGSIFREKTAIASYRNVIKWAKDIYSSVKNFEFNKLFALLTHEVFHSFWSGDETLTKASQGIGLAMGLYFSITRLGELNTFLIVAGTILLMIAEPIIKKQRLSTLLSHITVSPTEKEMGEEAARAILKDIEDSVDTRGKAVMLFASAPSQHSTWEALIGLWKKLPEERQRYLAERIIAFHMDEYLGLDETAPQIFGTVLQERVFSQLGIPERNIYYFNHRQAFHTMELLKDAQRVGNQGLVRTYEKEIENQVQHHIDDLLEKFKRHGGVFDIVVGGIGKHPHLAFNDAPLARFNDELIIKLVEITKTSRQQQVDDGEFEYLQDVPLYALTFSLKPILSARRIHIIVPREFKAEAVRQTLDLDVSEDIPASGLRLPNVLPNVRIYLDEAAASKSKVAKLARLAAEANSGVRSISNIPEGRCTLLSDKKADLLDTTPLPKDKKIAVIESRPGEAGRYADILLEQMASSKNDARYFKFYADTNIEALKQELAQYNPDIVLLPQHEDRSEASVSARCAVFETLNPLDRDGSKLVVGYDTPQRILNYNLFCPLTRAQWDVVKRGMACHVSQMDRVAYDKAVDVQARANAKLVRELIEPDLPEKFEYVLPYKLRKIENGALTDFGTNEKFIYYSKDIGCLKSFWPEEATITANSSHPDDTEIALGAPFSLSSPAKLGNDILSAVATVGWRVTIDGVDDNDLNKKIDIRVKEPEAGAAILGINTEFLNHPASLRGVGLPFYSYRVDDQIPEAEKIRLQREEQKLVRNRLDKRYRAHVRANKKMFILCNPESSDKHPDHQISKAYWLEAALQLSREKALTIMYQEFVSPWAGDFNAYVYSGKSRKNEDPASLSAEANAIPGGELLLSGGFAGRPPKLERFAQRFKIRSLKEEIESEDLGQMAAPAEVIGEASGEADFLESQRGILAEGAVRSSAQDMTGSSVVREGLRRLAPDHTLADGHEQVIPEAGDGTAAGLGESTDVAEATGAIAFIQDAEGVLGTEGRAEEWQIFNWTGSAFHRICGDIEKSRGDDAIKIEKIGVIPRGKSKFPIIAYVDPSAKKRIVGISEEFLEDMAGLCRLVNNRNESVSGAQLAIIRYIIEAAVLHEVGHGFEGYSGMDIHTLTKTPQVRNDFAELLGIQDAASMDSDKLVEAIADLNIGGKGNADYARNKAAYLFYKFLMHDPVMYVTSNGDVDTRSVTSAVDGYFSSNPLMAVMHEAETAGMVCGQAALFCGQFFGKGSRWRNENRLSQKSVPQERPQVLTKAQEAEKEREAQLRTKITSLVRQSASRSLGNAERARIRSSLARSENAAVALEIAEGMAESANRGSAEQRMLKATAREIKNVMGLHGGSAAGLGMGEESPEVLDFFKSITAKGYAPVRMSQRIGDTLYYIDSAKGKVVTVDLNGDLEAIKDTFIYLHAICLKEHPEFMTIVEKQSQDVARVYLRGSQLYRENPDFIALLEENGVLPAIEKTEKRNASMVSSVLAGHKAVVDTKGNIMSFGKNMREAYYRNRIIISSSKMQNVAHDMGKVEHLALEKMAALTDVEKHRQALLAGGKGETKIDTIKISGEEITKYEGQIAEIRRHLHIAGLEIASRGLVDGPGGNISSCTSDRRFMVIKASGKAFETMSPEEYVVVDIASGDVVEGFGEVLKPSVETFFHLAIYKTRDDVSSVVHTHPIYGTAVATSGYSIVVPGGQNIGRLPYVNPGRPELADAVRPVVKDADIVLIANHGAITVGKDIYAALRLTEELEYTAETAAKVLRTKVEQIDAETLVEDLLKAAYPVMTQRDITMQTRIKTALNYRGIDIIDELLGCSREDILKLRNMGNDVMSYLEGALSEFGLRLNTKPEKINIMTKLLETGKKRVSRIVEGITRHMNKGLRGDKDTSIAMYPSYATIPTGMETGEYLALDVGGTNLRVLRVRLEGNGKYTIVDKTESIAIPNSLKKRDPGTGRLPKAEELFDFIANAVKDFAAKQDFGTNTKIPMGFTWSFPVEQTGVASGIHKNWGKEWETEGVKGKDVVDLLNAALGLKAVNNVKVAALCNDTGGTFAVGRYLNPNCIMGVILGTGTNGAFYLPLSEIIKFKDNFASEDMVINTEWCNYTIPYRSIWDGVLDRESGNEKRHLLEKMVSGGYIGEVTRIILKDLISKKMLFAGQSSSAFDLKHDEEDDEKGIPGWYARHLDRIELDDSQELSDIQKLLEGLGIQNSTPEDRRIVREITTAVVMRSARVSAAAIASIIKRMNIDLAKEHTVAIDGSLFEYSPHFKERMEKLLIEEFGENAKNIKLTFTEDGSGVGAAIMAAVAEKHSLEKEGLAKSEKCTAKVKTAVDNLRTGKDVPTQTMILERTMTCPCSVPEAREIAQEALMERAREVSSFVENEFKEERSVVRKIIAEWVIKTGANIGPGAKAEIGAAMKKEEIVDLWKIVNLVHETKIQHIIAKPVAPKGVAKEALDELSKKLSTDNKEGDVEPGYFTSAKELESLLKPEKGVKKIVITTDDTTIQNAVNEVRASDPGLFRDVRLYPVSLPKTFRDKDQEAVYHAQMLFEATLVRLLDGENTQFIEALLETMFENRIYEGDSCVNPKTSYIDINKNTENETIAAAKKRVGDTMKLTVRLTELVERSLRFLRLFWASA